LCRSIGGAHAPVDPRPAVAIVGIATSGGPLTAGLRAELHEAVARGLSVVNGLPQFADDDQARAGLAREKGVTITDVRRVRPRGELHFWSGEIDRLATP